MLTRNKQKPTFDSYEERTFYAHRSLPAMFKQTLRIAPLALVVPLFSIARDKTGEAAEVNVVWSRAGRGHLRYRGPQLTQSHQTVLFTLANLRAGEVVSNAFSFCPTELLTKMGWSTKADNIVRLRELFDDLVVGRVRLWNEDEVEASDALRVSFVSAFKPAEKGNWYVTLSEDLLPLFAGNLTQINLPERASLSLGLATFLYAFVRAESCRLPFTFKEIRDACGGSQAEALTDFAKRVKKVLAELKEKGLVQDYRLERGGFRVLK